MGAWVPLALVEDEGPVVDHLVLAAVFQGDLHEVLEHRVVSVVVEFEGVAIFLELSLRHYQI